MFCTYHDFTIHSVHGFSCIIFFIFFGTCILFIYFKMFFVMLKKSLIFFFCATQFVADKSAEQYGPDSFVLHNTSRGHGECTLAPRGWGLSILASLRVEVKAEKKVCLSLDLTLFSSFCSLWFTSPFNL